MSRCDLQFSGQLLAGSDPRLARLRLTAFFQLTDPAAVEPFFSGRPVILRRNLPAGQATELCERLRAGGLDCHVIRRAGTSPAPNRFQIRPDTPSVAADADSRQLRFLLTALAATLLSLLLVAAVGLRLHLQSRADLPPGPHSMLATGDGQLLAALPGHLLLRDRGGNPRARLDARSLGLTQIGELLHVAGGDLLLSGTGPSAADSKVWRCPLPGAAAPPPCQPAAIDETDIASLDSDLLGRALFALRPDGTLLRIEDGATREQRPLPQAAAGTGRLIHWRGLLLIGHERSVGVYRPDSAAFGEQIDEILLLPPEHRDDTAPRLLDIALRNEGVSALLETASGIGLYGFDSTWRPEAATALPDLAPDSRITAWRDRVLIYSPDSTTVTRLSPAGGREAPLLLDDATDIAAARERRRAWQLAATALAIGLLAAATLFALPAAWATARLRQAADLPRGAPDLLLETRLQDFHWWRPALHPRAPAVINGLVIASGLSLAGCLLLQTWPGTALSLLFLATALAIASLLRAGRPQVGRSGEDVALVDHSGRYQAARADGIRQCGPFLLRGDVVLCLGLPLLHRAPLDVPLPTGIPPVSVQTLIASLARTRHPLFRSALGIVSAAGAALTLLLLP
jgi:hypothetical protein